MKNAALPSVGFIGLGAMGLPMARNIARKRAGNLCVYDIRTEVNAAASSWGATLCASPAEVAANCDIVVTMLPNDASVRAACTGADGIIASAKSGLSVIDFSTIGPWTIRDIHAQFAARGAQMHAGAVSLGVKAAVEGTLAVYLDQGAADDALISEVVRSFSSSIVPTVGLGSAKVIKLISNLMVGVNVAATAEAIALAEKAGLPADVLVPLILKGSGSSHALSHHMARAALVDDVGVGKFGIDYMLKDLDIALELARHSNQTMFFGTLGAAAYRGAKSMGYAANYYPIVLRWMERAAGVEPIQRSASVKEAAPQ